MGSPRRAPRAGREYICAQSLYATDPPHQIHVRFDACGGDRRRLRSRAPLIPHRASPACLTTWPAPRSPVPDLGKGGNSKFGGFKTPVVGRVVSYHLNLIRFLCTYFRSVTTCCVLSASRSATDVELYATIRWSTDTTDTCQIFRPIRLVLDIIASRRYVPATAQTLRRRLLVCATSPNLARVSLHLRTLVRTGHFLLTSRYARGRVRRHDIIDSVFDAATIDKPHGLRNGFALMLL